MILPRGSNRISSALLASFLTLGAVAHSAAAQPTPADARALQLVAASDAQRRALLAQATFLSLDVARALLAIGDKAIADNRGKEALLAYRTAETIARRAQEDVDVAKAVWGAAAAMGALGRVKEGTQLAEEALRVYERLADVTGQAEAWNGIGNGRLYLAHMPAALDAYGRAHALWVAAGDRRGIARALNNMANVRRELGQIDEALDSYQQALPVLLEVDDRLGAAVVTNNIGILLFDRGEYSAALEHCLRSLSMLEALQSASEQWGAAYRIGGALNAIGMIYRAQGEYARALQFHHRALTVRERFGDKLAIVEAWNFIGLVHFSQGNYALAADCYRRGLRLSPASGGNAIAPEALTNLAAAVRQLGQRARAEANYRTSLRISERDGYSKVAARDLHDLGRMALEDGRYGEADRLLKRALALRDRLKDQAGTAETLSGLAALRLANSRPAEALELAQRATDLAVAIDYPEIHWEAQTTAGIARRRLGEADAARRAFETAVGVIEGLRLQIAARDNGWAPFFESKLTPYRELVSLALARGAPAEALELVERSKARALGDLVRGRADHAGTIGADEQREQQRLRAALASLNARIIAERQRESPRASHLAALVADRESARLAFETFQAAAEAAHPQLDLRRGRAVPFRLADAAALLRDDATAILEYVLTGDAGYVFVLARGASGVRLDAFPLAAGRSVVSRQAERLRNKIAARDLSFADDARGLHRLLLGPALERLAGKTRLIVIPDGALWDVPFQVLQDTQGRYVIESAALSYAPSLTVLRESLRRRRDRPSTVLAMGKSDFGTNRNGPRPALMSALAPLPDAERQVRTIAALYGPDRSAAYVGAEAREDRFKEQAPHFSVLHLASHGLLDEGSPLYSHVVLSPGARGSSEDGLLEAWELMNLRLDADLMVLSACETGRGRIAPGEGIVGMSWAAFVAGARALVVSQWQVESDSTTRLMTAFHRGLARGAGGKADLLRRAALDILRTGHYAHPFYWAGFVLVGDPY